jgi:hypothetical protein
VIAETYFPPERAGLRPLYADLGSSRPVVLFPARTTGGRVTSRPKKIRRTSESIETRGEATGSEPVLREKKTLDDDGFGADFVMQAIGAGGCHTLDRRNRRKSP